MPSTSALATCPPAAPPTFRALTWSLYDQRLAVSSEFGCQNLLRSLHSLLSQHWFRPDLRRQGLEWWYRSAWLDAGEYPNAANFFFEDFKLMIRNCFVFNPAGTTVNQVGIDLQWLFDERWTHLLPLRDASDDEDEEYDTRSSY